MLDKVVLIVDKRVELSTKYKKLLEQSGIKVLTAENISASIKLLSDYEPDLLIISDSIEEEITAAAKNLRILSYSFRPVLVVLSKSEHQSDKLNVLEAGADDFLSEPIESEEFKARIKAHLRRHFENNINEQTQLFDSKVSLKVLKRLLFEENEIFCAMLISIDNFDFYREIYGDLAADKMLQTYKAIISSALTKNDYIGHVAQKDFLVVTKNLNAEKIASYLVYAFDSIAEKFYSSDDALRGYIIMQGDEAEGKRVSIVSTSIGIVSNEYKRYHTAKQLMNTLISTQKLAKMNAGSSYVKEHPKLSASDSVVYRDYNNRILIAEPDEPLAFLLYTTAKLQGFEANIVTDYNQIFEAIEDYNPAVIILDAGDKNNLPGLNICKKIKNDPLMAKSKIILSTVLHGKIKILNTGADLYLPKPYELITIFGWINKFFKEYNEMC